MKTSERSFARHLDLTTLQLFAAVCEHGSIGKAAASNALLYRHASACEAAGGSFAQFWRLRVRQDFFHRERREINAKSAKEENIKISFLNFSRLSR